MSIPKTFKVDDQDKQVKFIESYPFATLISTNAGSPIVSHVPLLVHQEEGKVVLQGHFAKANPHSTQFSDQEVLAVFHGPDSYISPSWYESLGGVPTWNYMAVHCSGRSKTIESSEWLIQFLARLTKQFEPTGVSDEWKFDPQADEIVSILGAIVGFEIEVSLVEAKFKLGQNRSKGDQQGVIRALKAIGSDHALGLVRATKSH